MRAAIRARLSCPWCPWLGEAEADTLEAVTPIAQKRVEEHAAEMGHAVIKGRKPRIGYYRGDPIS